VAKIEPKKGEKHVHGRRFLHATNFGEFSRSPMQWRPASICGFVRHFSIKNISTLELDCRRRQRGKSFAKAFDVGSVVSKELQ